MNLVVAKSETPSTHSYTSRIVWTGNKGLGTSDYKSYDRTWDIAIKGKPVVHCSNDPLLGGNPKLANPEDLLLSAVAACHMLWYLHLASSNNIKVTAYSDQPIGVAEVDRSGAGRFLKATLQPTITLAAECLKENADLIHKDIHGVCFIARSVNFPVQVEATYLVDV